MNGAVQGVATTVASTPLKNEFAIPEDRSNAPPAPEKEVPISKTPNKFSPNVKNRQARKTTNPEDCS